MQGLILIICKPMFRYGNIPYMPCGIKNKDVYTVSGMTIIPGTVFV